MIDRKKAIWAGACVAAGVIAMAAQAQYGGSGSDTDGFLVQLAPATEPSASATAAPLATAALTSTSTTVGGYIYDWTDLQAAIDADTEVDNGYFIVGNAIDPDYLFAYEKGSFDIDRVTPLASASKWFAGTLAMRMVEAGIVTLDDPMRPPLAFWTTFGTKKDVKLKHTLSMTSGFNASPLVGGCQLLPAMTLYNCAKSIHDLRYDSLRPGNAPGAQYSYGPHGLQIAAAYLEAKDTSIEPGSTPARQRNIHELFSQYVTDPLGMTNTTWYDPSGSAPTNPWIAGGAYSTPRDYAKLLRALLGGSFITDMTTFTQQRTAGLPRIFVPSGASDWEYALGSFVECDMPADCATSKINSSPGAYGWTGWIDRETGYYALIATEISSGGDRKGVELEQQMQDLIEAAIAARTPAS
ncbi:serine hydrolase domain-containing protein [Sphingopyxis alaskensis]|jgi:CubicO group peptidase (beta-lactamase class C family)|uniref:serine hydrolase domain-containing protein n=1 Tax=Sphingopyxis alaskensis TaxID=117207 RepID=UPI0020417365|nr:serine hydrolase domain-containing protein [Sphingopyxis alaskensis]MCM3420183.1 beta-lactamase family protein [Sphingopyxis alaskensis]